MTRSEEIAWASGLFEGEGCIYVQRGRWPVLVLKMVDRDVVERFADIIGCGSIRRERTAGRRKQIFRWQTTAVPQAKEVLELLVEHFGSRRRAAALSAIDIAASVRPYRRAGEK